MAESLAFTDKTLIEQYLIDHPDASALDIKRSIKPLIFQEVHFMIVLIDLVLVFKKDSKI
ncbi:putative transposase [Francisella tularensis]|nr:putative transposase [Francisella tularensis]